MTRDCNYSCPEWIKENVYPLMEISEYRGRIDWWTALANDKNNPHLREKALTKIKELKTEFSSLKRTMVK